MTGHRACAWHKALDFSNHPPVLLFHTASDTFPYLPSCLLHHHFHPSPVCHARACACGGNLTAQIAAEALGKVARAHQDETERQQQHIAELQAQLTGCRAAAAAAAQGEPRGSR